jgi:phosphoribosylformylglycinamidine synthase subunit PurL
MGSRAGTGVEIDLALVPQRASGMTPYEIMLSESQERMLIVADKGREAEVFAVFHKWGLDAVTIGRVTDDGLLRVKNHGVVVAEIPNRELADEAPLYDRPHNAAPYRSAPMEAPKFSSNDLQADLLKLVASGDLCSKRWIWQQYDYQVRTNTLAGPGSDAAIVRIKETDTSIAMSLDGNGRYCSLSPREGARLLVAECCRNLSTVGAVPVAATNNLNFGNPERPEIMAQLVEAIEGMAEACRFFETPITGGNVSLYNETLGEAIWPTPVLGIVGLMKTAAPVTIPFKEEGSTVMLVGGFGSPDATRFGGTQYAKVILEKMWGLPPALDMNYEKRVHAAIREIVNSGHADSAHDVGDGGLAVALAESTAGGMGAAIELPDSGDATLALFHEGPSRILISTATPEGVEKIARAHNVDAVGIGVTMKEKLRIDYGAATVVDCPIAKLQKAWENALPERLVTVHV